MDEAGNEASAALIDGLAAYDYIELDDGRRDAELAALADGRPRTSCSSSRPDFESSARRRDGPGGVCLDRRSGPGPGRPGTAPAGRRQAPATRPAGNPPGGGGAPPVTFESVESRDLGYIDFLVPGIVGMTVMQLGLFGVAFGFVQLKRTGALRRLFATPDLARLLPVARRWRRAW